VSVRCGGGTGGMSVVHRSGKNDRRAPLLRRSAKGRRGGFPPLVNGGPFSLCRCPCARCLRVLREQHRVASCAG